MDERTLVDLVTPILEAKGLELDGLDIIPAGKRKVVRISVDGDGPKGRGPLLDDIASATRDISDAIDASPKIGDAPFTLEVSSRGVGKPLTEPKHFRRNLQRLLSVTTVAGTTTVGRLTEASETQITLVIEPEPGKRLPKGLDPVVPINLDEVTKAVVKVEMNRKHDPELDDLGDEDDEEDENFVPDDDDVEDDQDDEEN